MKDILRAQTNETIRNGAIYSTSKQNLPYVPSVAFYIGLRYAGPPSEDSLWGMGGAAIHTSGSENTKVTIKQYCEYVSVVG